MPSSLARMTLCQFHSGIAARLLAAGAPPAALDRGRRTPLHWAALNGHSSTVRVLADALQAAESDWHAQVLHDMSHSTDDDEKVIRVDQHRDSPAPVLVCCNCMLCGVQTSLCRFLL